MPTPRSMRARASGFTLIELLVVMAIIATLAGLSIYGIPRIVRQKDITVCQSHLGNIFQTLQLYETRYQSMPNASGPAFVLGPWRSQIVDHTDKDSEIYFCPSMKKQASAARVEPEEIDYTGPNQEGSRKGLSTADRNANDKVIIADKVIPVVVDADADELPHAAKGICFLTLGGATQWIDAAEFGDYPVIGPDSPIEKFKRLVPEEQR